MSEDVDVEIYFLHEDERSEIVKSILTSKAIAVGAPTIYDQPFPSIGDLIYYLKGLQFNRTGRNRLAVTFGSMGGQGGAPEILKNELNSCGFDVQDADEIMYVPTEDELTNIYEIGKKLAKKLKEE